MFAPLCRHPQRALLTAPGYEDWAGGVAGPAWGRRVRSASCNTCRRKVHGPVRSPQLLDELYGLVQPLYPLPDGIEGKIVGRVLHLEPPRPDPEYQPTPADDVHGRGRLGQQHRVSVCIARHHRPDGHGLRHPRKRPENCPRLQARPLVAARIGGNQVIVTPEGVKSQLLDEQGRFLNLGPSHALLSQGHAELHTGLGGHGPTSRVGVVWGDYSGQAMEWGSRNSHRVPLARAILRSRVAKGQPITSAMATYHAS